MSTNLKYFLGKRRSDLKTYCVKNNFETYEKLIAHLKEIGVEFPTLEEYDSVVSPKFRLPTSRHRCSQSQWWLCHPSCSKPWSSGAEYEPLLEKSATPERESSKSRSRKFITSKKQGRTTETSLKLKDNIKDKILKINSHLYLTSVKSGSTFLERYFEQRSAEINSSIDIKLNSSGHGTCFENKNINKYLNRSLTGSESTFQMFRNSYKDLSHYSDSLTIAVIRKPDQLLRSYFTFGPRWKDGQAGSVLKGRLYSERKGTESNEDKVYNDFILNTKNSQFSTSDLKLFGFPPFCFSLYYSYFDEHGNFIPDAVICLDDALDFFNLIYYGGNNSHEDLTLEYKGEITHMYNAGPGTKIQDNVVEEFNSPKLIKDHINSEFKFEVDLYKKVKSRGILFKEQINKLPKTRVKNLKLLVDHFK
tara:strand:+ start:14023 stop:15279 length:1257 start_codon:yes stop_codon:yes gene_type:complete